MENPIVWSPGMTLAQMEFMVVRKALIFYQNNKTQTASALGISIQTLYTRLEEIKEHDDEVEKARIKRIEENEELLRQSRFGRGQPLSSPSPEVPGLAAKPAPGFAPEPALSMREQSDVQQVLPRKTVANGSGRNR